MSKYVIYIANRAYIEFSDELTMAQWYDHRFDLLVSRGRRRKKYGGRVESIKTMLREYFPAEIKSNGDRISLYWDYVDNNMVYNWRRELPKDEWFRVFKYGRWFDNKLKRDLANGTNLHALYPTTRGQSRDCLFNNTLEYHEKNWKNYHA